MPYFVVIEIIRTGFYIGTYKSLAKAYRIKDRLLEMAGRHDFKDSHKLVEDLSGHRKYTIGGDPYDCKPAKHITSNGTVNVCVCQFSKKYKDIDAYIREREFQTVLFPDLV